MNSKKITEIISGVMTVLVLGAKIALVTAGAIGEVKLVVDALAW